MTVVRSPASTLASELTIDSRSTGLKTPEFLQTCHRGTMWVEEPARRVHNNPQPLEPSATGSLSPPFQDVQAALHETCPKPRHSPNAGGAMRSQANGAGRLRHADRNFEADQESGSRGGQCIPRARSRSGGRRPNLFHAAH